LWVKLYFISKVVFCKASYIVINLVTQGLSKLSKFIVASTLSYKYYLYNYTIKYTCTIKKEV
jgi:hypothetical protein